MVKSGQLRNEKFAAFIMTYERPHCLQESLKNLLSQTFAPAHVLIVDNSESNESEAVVEKLFLPNVAYHRMGYNSGPAGASHYALKELTAQGYEWIYWGDDDNPPRDQFVFEKLFRKLGGLQPQKTKVGIIGGKGGKFNRFTGRVSSLSNAELRKANLLEVDTVPGGHMMIVNSAVVKRGILPGEKLFFGFEELDFSLRIKKEGFKIFVDSEDWLQVRIAAQNSEDSFKFKGSSFGNTSMLRREYYSSRNLLYILFHHGIVPANFFMFFKIMLKSVYGFRFGISYGSKNFKIQGKAVLHFLTGNLGKLE